MQTIPIDVLINILLVKNNIRPAMMVQHADYEEQNIYEPKTKNILQYIQNNFSEMYIIYNLQGAIISKENIYETSINTDNIGIILGYPCAIQWITEYNTLNISHYTINFCAISKDDEQIILFSNICFIEIELIKLEFLKIVEHANTILSTNNELCNLVKIFYITYSQIIDETILIDKLKTKSILLENELSALKNIIWNFGFIKIIDHIEKNNSFIQYNNSIHCGIIISLLIQSKYKPYAVFFPLYEYPIK